MAGNVGNCGYNMGLEMVNCYQKYFDFQETGLNKLIDKLKVSNLQIKIMSDVMNKLSHAKQTDKKYVISEEDERKYAYFVHLRNPSIFEGKVHNLPVEEMGLEEKVISLIDEMKKDGLHDDQITLEALFERSSVEPAVQFDELSEDDIDIVVQGLDSELKMLNADLNERMMLINNKYEDRSQMTENARQVVKEADELNKSILQRMTRG